MVNPSTNIDFAANIKAVVVGHVFSVLGASRSCLGGDDERARERPVLPQDGSQNAQGVAAEAAQ